MFNCGIIFKLYIYISFIFIIYINFNAPASRITSCRYIYTIHRQVLVYYAHTHVALRTCSLFIPYTYVRVYIVVICKWIRVYMYRLAVFLSSPTKLFSTARVGPYNNIVVSPDKRPRRPERVINNNIHYHYCRRYYYYRILIVYVCHVYNNNNNNNIIGTSYNILL